jgi:signal transduction histidine kinase
MLRDSVQDPTLVSEVQAIEGVISEADERASSLSFELSPPILHEVGLAAAAHSLAEDMESRFGLKVSVEDDGKRGVLDEATRITLFRALRELLLNVTKHARIDEVRVRLWREDELMKIVVEDEGVGFDSGAGGSGYGLFSIRERVDHLGGSMQIESKPGEGTRICLTAPSPDRDENST